MIKLTKLKRIQLEIELEEIIKNKMDSIELRRYDIAAGYRGQEKALRIKLGLDMPISHILDTTTETLSDSYLLATSKLMNSNYKTSEVGEIKTACEGMSHEEILSQYQAVCDTPKGLLMYLTKGKINTKTTIGDKLLMRSVTINVRDTEATLKQMDDISNKSNFAMWAGSHKQNKKENIDMSLFNKKLKDLTTKPFSKSNESNTVKLDLDFKVKAKYNVLTLHGNHIDLIKLERNGDIYIKGELTDDAEKIKSALIEWGKIMVKQMDGNNTLNNTPPKQEWVGKTFLKTKWISEIGKNLNYRDAKKEMLELVVTHLKKELNNPNELLDINSEYQLMRNMELLGYKLGPRMCSRFDFSPYKQWYKTTSVEETNKEVDYKGLLGMNKPFIDPKTGEIDLTKLKSLGESNITNPEIRLNKTQLKIRWAPEAIDGGVYHKIEAEAEYLALTVELLKLELNTTIARTLLKAVNTHEELFTAMGKLGYKLSPRMYDQTNFAPFRVWEKK